MLNAEERRFHRAVVRKVDALEKLAYHVGLLGAGSERREKPPVSADFLWACLGRIVDSDAWPAQRRACALLLDMYVPLWRELVPPEALGYIVERNSVEVARWRRAALERDGHSCQECGSVENLHVHHLIPWADAPELRIVVDNGITLCSECHADEHPNLHSLIARGSYAEIDEEGNRKGGFP